MATPRDLLDARAAIARAAYAVQREPGNDLAQRELDRRRAAYALTAAEYRARLALDGLDADQRRTVLDQLAAA